MLGNSVWWDLIAELVDSGVAFVQFSRNLIKLLFVFGNFNYGIVVDFAVAVHCLSSRPFLLVNRGSDFRCDGY